MRVLVAGDSESVSRPKVGRVTTHTASRLDSVVVLRARLETSGLLNPQSVQGLLGGLIEYVAIGVCLTDRRLIPLERTRDGSTPRVPKEVVFQESRGIVLGPTGLGRGTGEGDFVAWQPTLVFEQTVNMESATVLLTHSLIRVRRLSYVNPLEAVLEVLIPFAAGGSLLAFLQWATLLRANRRKAEGEASAVEIANELAIAQVSRDPREAAERLVGVRATTLQLLSLGKAEEANARFMAAQAEALELENFKKRVLLAQELEDYIREHPELRPWTEAQLVALLRPPITQASLEAMAALKPEIELLLEDPEIP